MIFHVFEEARKRNCETLKIGIVEENKKLRKWYETHGFIHTGTEKYDFFPFTCGYMEKPLTPPREPVKGADHGACPDQEVKGAMK